MTTRTLLLGLLICTSFANARAGEPPKVMAASSDTFLSSLGVCTHVDQGYDPTSYAEPLRYLGIRAIRDGPHNLPGLLMLHQQSGILVDLIGWDIADIMVAARTLARSDALLAIEGPNEPNNFPIDYKGRQGGGHSANWLPDWVPSRLHAWLPSPVTWVPIAEFQRDLYSAIKNDEELSRYPVFSVSEGGAETDNVGLQFLTIPAGAGTLLPAGTRFADFANVHNYASGIRIGYVDNQAWQAADPVLDTHWDGLLGEYGRTWFRHFEGYPTTQLEALPRVTTETGWEARSLQDERTQGIVLVNTYLAQFKRGWRYTFIYEVGEGEGGGGNYGLFHSDWSPKLAATYVHNLTSILADHAAAAAPSAELSYAIEKAPDTIHDLLLRKSNGTFELVIWGEQVAGSNSIKVSLDRPRRSVNVYDITVGTDPIQTLGNVADIPLTVGDHALILEID
ncbi:MAG: glycosyl hydrolase [Bradyrhizobium sp.]|uniref:glycosyl hydrolase n=1 Tax=Bradyrhizobium sp. TaxID=376 RepID=UPI001D2010D7|nr:glycosyl hydrolase [Bradyrhizobium sp.]MBV9561743.1 glycosyl hydrolase [Bradyrhizobium sp.]